MTPRADPSKPAVSVVLATHDPHPGRFARVLDALASQTLREPWEIVIVDNASAPAVRDLAFAACLPSNARVVVESRLGLAAARRRGFGEARAGLVVLVDDDNVLSDDYLALAWQLAHDHPAVGAFGGKSVPKFEAPPEPWMRQFDGLIACRDLGNEPRVSARATGSMQYPDFAPIGAGMCIRREAFEPWMRADSSGVTDRVGRELTSGGDNDIVLCAMKAGWQVAYFPELSLQHLIPAERTSAGYLKRLNRGINKSWMQVLSHHDANPFPPIAAWTVPLRSLKAWFAYRAWQGPASSVRWHGAIGHFEGRARGRTAPRACANG